MEGKLNKWHAVRVSDEAWDAISNMPFEKRKRMNSVIRGVIEATIRSETSAPVPEPSDTSGPESV